MKKILQVVQDEEGNYRWKFHSTDNYMEQLGILSILKTKILRKEKIITPEDDYMMKKEEPPKENKESFWKKKRQLKGALRKKGKDDYELETWPEEKQNM